MVTSIAPTAPAPDVTSLDQSNENATTALYRATIGPINTDYYLPIFSRFEASNRVNASWNSAACLSTLNWMVFRSLWGAALVYIGALLGSSLMVFGIGRMLLQFSEMAEMALWVVFGAATFVIPGFYGNALMHTDCRKKMAAALTVTQTLTEACTRLNQQAASRQRFIWLALFNLAGLGVVAGAYLAISAFSSPPSKPAPAAVIPITDRSPLPAAVASAPAITAASSAPSPAASEPTLMMPAPMAFAASAPSPAASHTANPNMGQAIMVAPNPLIAVAAPPPVQEAVKAAHSYYVNVGLFAKDSNAHNAHAKLLAAGLPAHTHELKTTQGKNTRVRVGPFETRKQADAAVEKIHALKLDAVVVKP